MSVTPSLSWREEIPVGEAEAHEAPEVGGGIGAGWRGR